MARINTRLLRLGLACRALLLMVARPAPQAGASPWGPGRQGFAHHLFFSQ